MIKRTQMPGMIELVEYVCENCVKVMPGAPIMVYYPYGHSADSIDGPSHYCSSKCMVEFETKLVKKYGNWKSDKSTSLNVKSSAEWRAVKSKKTETTDSPKARRAKATKNKDTE